MRAAAQTGSGLLEREPFVDALETAYAGARTGHGRLALVTSDPGGGKTVLLRYFCAERSDSSRILWGACDALFTPQPLGPIHDIAQNASSDFRDLVRTEAIPYQVAAALVRDLSDYGPTVLVLEDVHWADEATLDVLKLLIRKIESVPVLAILSYRDEAVSPSHPFRIMLGEAATGVGVDRVRLPPLSPAAVAELAEPYDVEPHELYRVTSGNPFFVTEVLASGGAEIPPTVRDAVLARVGRLSPEARSVLEAVAITPPGAELWLVEALSGPADRRLDECVESGMLESSDGTVSFRHELARLTVEESLPSGRQLGLHRTALEALIARRDASRDLARRAHHAEAARDEAAVLRYAPAAGAHASSVGAHREAAAQYHRALRFADGVTTQDRAQLLERYSHECYLTDQADEAIDALRRATECYRGLGDTLREGDTLRRLSNILWCPGRGREALPMALEAAGVLEQLPAGRELVDAYCNLSFLRRMAGDSAAAQDWGQRALELARRLDDPETLSGALLTVGMLEGEHALEAGLSLAQRDGLDELVIDGLFGLAWVAADRRAYDVAERHIENGLAVCSEHGNDLMPLYLLGTRARTQLERGQWTQAAESAGLVLAERTVSTLPRTHALVVLGLVRARRGDPDAEALLDEAWALAWPTGELWRMAPVAVAKAETAWLRGDLDVIPEITGDTLDRRDAGPVRTNARRAPDLAEARRSRRGVRVVRRGDVRGRACRRLGARVSALGRASAVPTKPRSPSPVQTTTARSGERSTRHSVWAHVPWRRSWVGGCETVGCVTSVAGRSPPRAPTPHSSQPASWRCSGSLLRACATPR